MKIIEVNVFTRKEKVVASHVPLSKVEEAKDFFRKRLYKNNRYEDYIIEAKDERYKSE